MYQEFDHLLEEQSPIESYIEWLDTMVDRCVVKVGKLSGRRGPGYCSPLLAVHTVVQSPAASSLNVPEQPRSPGVLRIGLSPSGGRGGTRGGLQEGMPRVSLP